MTETRSRVRPAERQPRVSWVHRADCCVLRTPFLSWDDFARWGSGLRSPSVSPACDENLDRAVEHDVAELRARTRELLAIPGVREAIYLASPDLEASLHVWETDPASERGARIERGLLRYLARMAGRATPFGLFSGCAVGSIGPATSLSLGPRAAHRRATRLDAQYLVRLCGALVRRADNRRTLTWRPNSSLYRVGDQWRYVQWRTARGESGFHLVSAQASEHLAVLLHESTRGATIPRLVELVQSIERDALDFDRAADFVERVIDAQLLVPDLSPSVTGGDVLADIIAQLAPSESGRDAAACLSEAAENLRRIDAAPLGACPARYHAVAVALDRLPATTTVGALFDATLVPATDALTVGADMLDDIAAGVDVLRRIVPPVDPLRAFRRQFRTRYEEREVPLCEVLDDEVGIGLPGLAAGAARLRLDPADVDADMARHAVLSELLVRSARRGEHVLRPSDDDVARLEVSRPAPLPGSFAVNVTVVGAPNAARASEAPSVVINDVVGPSGAMLLGRFCHSDPALDALVRRHVEDEAALYPEAIVAEIAHWPRGRIGNGSANLRPVLRGYEIPFLGRSGIGVDREIPIADLRIRLVGDRIVLRSARLGREIIPRLGSAHNFRHAFNLPLYQFLGVLQSQGTHARLGWSWGRLAGLPFLPRVVVGRSVLARAQWTIGRAEAAALDRRTSADRVRAVRTLRQARELPRYLVVADGDNRLPVDLDAPLSVDVFVDLVRKGNGATLVELYPSPDEMAACGPEGRYVHELVIPFVQRATAPPPASPSERRPGDLGVRRRFTPTSEWMSLAIYTGEASADRVLRGLVAPIVRGAQRAGAVDRWFFLRYLDPDFHVRVRLHGEPHRLRQEIAPRIEEHAAEWMENGLVVSLRYDVYSREAERYGGPRGIVLAERLFHADSEAALALIEAYPGDSGSALRPFLTLRGINSMVDDFALTPAMTADVLALDPSPAAALRHGWSDQFRAHRRRIELALGETAHLDQRFVAAARVLETRSACIRAIAEELWALDGAGELERPVSALVRAFLHMHVNRLLRRINPNQEQMYYDLVRRYRESIRARAVRAAVQ